MTARQDIVLVVDDDLAVRNSLKFSLELEGFKVQTCGSGRELLEHPNLEQAKCILLDYRMPEMDGFEVLENLSKSKARAPVILLTSASKAKVAERAHSAGVRFIAEKPFLDGSLLFYIRDVLSTSYE